MTHPPNFDSIIAEKGRIMGEALGRSIRRNAYACAAMHALLSADDGGQKSFDSIARIAFRMADSMLAAESIADDLKSE